MVRICLTTGLFLVLGIHGCLGADGLYLIISPNSTTLTSKGLVDFDPYIYNSSDSRVEIPAPQGGYDIVWKLHDICKIRPDRDGSNSVVGVHTVEPYRINPRSAVRCEHLGSWFDAEPGDVLEFYMSIERKLNSGAVQTIRSNSVVMYRPRNDGHK